MLTKHPEFEIFTTADGSPTLAFRREDGYVEKMHHTGGALSESLFIYGAALETRLGASASVRILSLGLGLAYNELISLAHLARAGREDFKIWSFEVLTSLIEGVQGWTTEAGVPPAGSVASVVADVGVRVAGAFGLEPEDLKSFARRALEDGRWELRGAFPEDATGVSDTNVVYYDAYSNKMDPDLWLEEFLVGQLGPCLTPSGCTLATYAATGAMKRALKQLGFSLQPKAGFLGKRQSTLAIR